MENIINKVFDETITLLGKDEYDIDSLLNILALTCGSLEGREQGELFAAIWEEKRQTFIEASGFNGPLWANPTAHHARFIDGRIKMIRIMNYSKLSPQSRGLYYFYERELKTLLQKARNEKVAMTRKNESDSQPIELGRALWNPIGDWKSPWLFID